MASRRTPLRPKNVDFPPVKGKIQKKPRSLVPPMDKEDLLALLRKINDKHCSPEVNVAIMESDLTHPTAERVEQIYHMLLNVLFATNPSMFSQMPFSSPEHPELYDGFHYVINFLRVNCRLMDACVVPEHDFGPHDLTDPVPKRTQFFLMAIANYIKFTQHVNNQCKVLEYEERQMESSSKLQEVRGKNEELKQLITQLKKQKVEEKEAEDTLCEETVNYEKSIKELQHVQETSEDRRKACVLSKEETEKQLAAVNEEYLSHQSRLEELKLQIVSSPEELRDKLSAIDDELGEMRSVHEECLRNHNMWEMLCNKAENVLPAVTSIMDDVNNLIEKANKENKLCLECEKIEEEVLKTKQIRKECLAKQQNIVRHLKLIQEGIAKLNSEMNLKPNEDWNTELEREVMSLKLQVEEKTVRDAEMAEQREEKRLMLDKIQQDHSKVVSVYEKTLKMLRETYESYKQNLESTERKIRTL